MSYQEITLLGHLGRDAEMRYLGDGTPVLNFSMATNRSWPKSDGEWESETTWFRVSCFGKSFEPRLPRLDKGTQVLVVGRLVPNDEGNPRIYKDRASFEVRCQVLRIVSASDTPREEAEKSDIPF